VTITIRPETAADAQAVRALLTNAFETPAEAELVQCLRRDGDLVLALVAVDAAHRIVGHVAFPRLHVGDEYPAVGLAPLAVVAAHRRRGVGAALVRAGLERLVAGGETIVFVLGNPAYYKRFGFALEAARPFTCVYAGPYFMAIALADNAPRAGVVRYPASFASVT
jgi:putative acetyltransferase